MKSLNTYLAAGPVVAEGLRFNPRRHPMFFSSVCSVSAPKKRAAPSGPGAADIIAVDDNPLENIQTLKKVTLVMKEERVVK